jgi:polyphenol oxidase
MAEIVTSALLTSHGFRHGFATRRGGVSEAPFDTLNFGRAVGDTAAAVAENHARLADAVGYAVLRLFETSQVHGARTHVLDGVDVEATRRVEADAILAVVAGDAVGVRTADCVPVLVGDPASGAALAIHAGWRGVAARIVPTAVALAAERVGAPASRFVVAIGPHIRTSAFEVGDDVAASLAAASSPDVVQAARPGARPHVDLARAVRLQLTEVGVDPANVDDVGGCAHDERDRFFSFRRDGQRSGRMLSVIVAR